jgi:hypothetical protein
VHGADLFQRKKREDEEPDAAVGGTDGENAEAA